MRKYSLDELPQLLTSWAARCRWSDRAHPYGRWPPTTHQAARKLRVRPGLTGLWHVNGRSDLSWEELVRLDLRYVENWSLALDALILWKTIGTIAGGEDAY